MDFVVPPAYLPTPKRWLTPQQQQFDQWARLSIGYTMSLTVVAPILRATMLRMAQREQRRQKRFVPPLEGPYLPFESTIDALKKVWTMEGWRGYYRGMGSLYIIAPIRAAYHILLFNLIEPNDRNTIRSDNLVSQSNISSTSITDDRAKNPKIKSQNQIVSEALDRRFQSPYTSNHSTSSSTTTQTDYLLKAAGIIVAGELFMYPAIWAFTRLSGDLLGDQKSILTNRSTTLILNTIKREGILSVYKGFFPCVLAVGIPALVYANFRFTKRYEQMQAERREATNPTPKQQDTTSIDALIENQPTYFSKMLEEYRPSDEVMNRFSRLWILASLLTYPIITIQVRMAIGNQARIPREYVLPHLSPFLRNTIAKLLPSYSTASTSAFKPTYVRTVESGIDSGYAAFAWVMGLRVAFDIGISVFSTIVGFPLNLYASKQQYGQWSLAGPTFIEEMKEKEGAIELERQKAIARVLAHIENDSPYKQNQTVSSAFEDNSMRYDDSDDALNAMGFKTIIPTNSQAAYRASQSQMQENIKQTKSEAEMWDEMQLSEFLASKPSERSTSQVPVVPGGNKEDKQVPTSKPAEEASTTRQAHVPLLSQNQTWYNSSRKSETSNRL